MDDQTEFLFTHNGLRDAPEDLPQVLAVKFLSLIEQSGQHPAKMLFYTAGVKLACQGSSVIEQLKTIEEKGVELVLSTTSLDYFKLTDKVAVVIVGGMPDIIEAIYEAGKVVSL